MLTRNDIAQTIEITTVVESHGWLVMIWPASVVPLVPASATRAVNCGRTETRRVDNCKAKRGGIRGGLCGAVW